jgi:hypothetical protein
MERILVKIVLAGFVITFLGWPVLTGQSLIFEKNVSPYPEHPDFGPNRRHFIHPVLQLNTGVPPTIQKNQTPAYLSAGAAGGFRYKLKISPLLAIGADCGISYDHWRKSPAGSTGQPDSVILTRQSLRTFGAYTSGFLRIKTQKSGDYLGRFVDIGISGNFPLLANLVTHESGGSNNAFPINSDIIRRQRISGLTFCELGGFMRVGNNKASLIVIYRQSQILPCLFVGLEYAVMRY